MEQALAQLGLLMRWVVVMQVLQVVAQATQMLQVVAQVLLALPVQVQVIQENPAVQVAVQV